MTRSFIYRTPLFSRPVKLLMWQAIPLDIIIIGGLGWAMIQQAEFLRSFASGQQQLRGSVFTVALLGALGVYSFRFAMVVAALRNNRKPQPVEWLITLVGLGVAVVAMAFNTAALNVWAQMHGYTRCEATELRQPYALFVKEPAVCPKS